MGYKMGFIHYHLIPNFNFIDLFITKFIASIKCTSFTITSSFIIATTSRIGFTNFIKDSNSIQNLEHLLNLAYGP